jgi:hypothetical protein
MHVACAKRERLGRPDLTQDVMLARRDEFLENALHRLDS